MEGTTPILSGSQYKPVRTRRVFYVPGFDPMPARRYRELYRKEGARQATISGYSLSLTAGDADGPYGWDVTTEINGQVARTHVEVLKWDDLVRASMDVSIPRSFAQMGATLWLYLRSGALIALFGLRPGPMITALYPVAALLTQFALSLVAGALLFRLLMPFVPFLALPFAAAAFAGTMIFFRRIDTRIYAYYLLQDYAFSASEGGRTPSALEPRLREFATRISGAMASENDEVLIVGHSSGAQLAVILAAMVLRDMRRSSPPGLSLLTLGQVIPMTSFLPDAQELRRDLAYLSTHPDIAWADVSAPGDGASFALCDPVQVTGVAPADAAWPVTISAAFSQTLSKQTWRRVRWRFFRLHMQYLCAFEHPRDYDYFRITAGPQSLGSLLAARQNSPSRIVEPRSRYRDTAP